MLTVPDRISGLIEQLEGGGVLTQEVLRRTATLQSLDLAKLGQDFVEETCKQWDTQLRSLEKEPQP